jgi:Inorganic Pyrophosphatase
MTTFKGLHIRIENPAGSIRRGTDRVTGKPWETKLTHDYGEIIGTNGVDNDPVDVFLGPDKSAPFVHVVHQLQKSTGEWDEDKCFLGFNHAMDAKAAYFKNYDNPELFYGSIETIPFESFKKQVLSNSGEMIHGAWDGMSVTVGDPVTVDGMRGRGVVTEDNGDDVIVRFRNGEHIKRKKYNVHNMGGNTYHSRYMSAGQEQVEMEGNPVRVPHGTGKSIEKRGTLFCVVSDGVDKNFGCYGSMEQANAVMNGKSFIEPDIPAGMYAATDKCPKCGSKKFALMPTDFETAKCSKCGKTWNYGIKAGGVGSGRHKGLNKFKDWKQETKNANKAPGQMSLFKPPKESMPKKKFDPDNPIYKSWGGEFDKKEINAMPQTGWQYGKRTMPVGYVPQRTLSGFPSGKGGGRGSLPKAPKLGGVPTSTSMAKPHPHVKPNIAKPAKSAVHPSPPKTISPMPKMAPLKKYAAPKVAKPPAPPKATTIKAPKPSGIIKAPGAHKTLEGFGDLGEPMAGALGHAHIEPESWFHPPSERHPRRIPTDDVGEKDDRFLDVTKRKQAHEDRMKLLKHGIPGGLPPLIPAQTTGLAPHQAYYASSIAGAKLKLNKKDKLIDIIPRNTSLRVPHQVAYVPGVRAGRARGIRRAFNAAQI